MSEDAACDFIVRGFLNLDDQVIPPAVRAEVERTIAAAKSGAL